jgi:hypothetical protein
VANAECDIAVQKLSAIYEARGNNQVKENAALWANFVL